MGIWAEPCVRSGLPYLSRSPRSVDGILKLGATASAPGRIAGLREISGTSQELSTELMAELLQWMRAKDGFNDLLAKRCAPSVSVGLVLTGEGASASAQRTDVSIDVNCRALSMVQHGEEFSYSYFDPSCQQIFSILRRTFPTDQELKRALDRQREAPTGAAGGD